MLISLNRLWRYNECSLEYITFYQNVFHSFIHLQMHRNRCWSSRWIFQHGLRRGRQQLQADLTDDVWVSGLAAKTARVAAVPSGMPWPRAVNKIRKIGIYEGAADKVLDPPALQLCHMPLTEWLMLLHCRMAEAACTDLVQNVPTGELEWWVW